MLLALAITTVFTAGCGTVGKPTASWQPTPTAFDSQNARKTYVDDNYRKYLDSGRASDENAAKALAGLDWDSHERRAKASDDVNVSWSSESAAKREQEKFESDLRKLGYD